MGNGDPAAAAKAEILKNRAEREKEALMERRRLAPYKARIAERTITRDWPIDARTMDRADLDQADVLTPLPDDFGREKVDDSLKREAEEAIANESQTDVVHVDPGLLNRRRSERDAERRARASVVGPTWTAEIVEARIEESFRVIARSSGGARFGPKSFGNNMPTPLTVYSDVVAQAGNASLRKAVKRLLRNDGPPSIEEVRRMQDAISWPVTYLRDERQLALYVNLGGMWKAWGSSITQKCKEIGVHRQQFYRLRKEALQIIADGLTKDGRAPT